MEQEKVWTFTIADNGPGIPEAILQTLFEPFVTHDKTTGTGLGLAICEKIVSAHGGTITASNRSNGACFTIELPRPR